MRIVLYNLQYQEIFAETVKSRITRKNKSPGGKYSYLFNHFFNLFEKIYIYTGKNFISSLSSFNIDKIIQKKLEIKIWLKINNFDQKKVVFIKDLEDIDEKDTILFGSARTLLELEDFSELKETKMEKILFLSHIFYKPNELNKILKEISPDLLISENNLFKNSTFFREIFSSYKKNVYHLPFVPQERFKVKTCFENRKNKCVATGTWRNYQGPAFDCFLNFFGVKTLHPDRKYIALHREELKEQIEPFMSNHFDKDIKKEILSSDNKLIEIYKRIYNVFREKKKYFSQSIVDVYNSYQMAVVPEEIVGVPGIGFAESMMCGCVFFGKKDPMYTDIGMIPEKHYVSYKNIAELKEKVAHYQNNKKELKKIALASLHFAEKNFSAKKVSEDLFQELVNREEKNESYLKL